MHRNRSVLVRADAVTIADLPEVHRAVLVSQDRLPNLVGTGLQTRHRARHGVLMCQRLHRDRHSGQSADLRAPDPRAAQHGPHRHVTLRGADGADPLVLHVEPDHLGVTGEPHAEPFCFAGHRFRGANRLGDSVGGHVQAAVDARRIELRDAFLDLPRIQQLAPDAPSGGQSELALEVLPALRRRGDLDPADLVEAGAAVEFQPGEAPDGVFGKPAHRFRRIGLENQSRRVGTGAAGGEQRALLDDEDVGDPEAREVVSGAAPDDAGPDKEDLGA